MMRIARLTTLLGILAAVTTGSLAGASTVAVAAPTGLHGFMLTAGEASASTFHRNPSFAWRPMTGALTYELQIATAANFRENSVLADISHLQTPVGAPIATIPWITGSPHSLYARVRAFFGRGVVSPWSADYGFDVVAPKAPTSIPAASGLLRWSLVDGADAYEVWLVDKGQTNSIEVTRSNVVDERDFYYNGQWPDTVHWRVRALRTSVFTPKNFMPAATYGPWSPIYTSTNTAPTTDPIALVSAVSDTVSDDSPGSPVHENMPGFVWSGSQTLDGGTAQYFRVYVFTDSQCVNPVFVGAAVPSPAYAARVPGNDLPPNSRNAFVDPGNTSIDASADGNKVFPNEQRGGASDGSLNLGPLKLGKDDNHPFVGPPTDLWDTNWPTGGYYWTVVGTTEIADNQFVDTELPQDACAAGRVQRFGISSQPTTTGNRGTFATGLSATGRLVSAAHTAKFYGEPLVAWTPAISASIYQLQWSRGYPFRARGALWTFTTSTVLPLKPGTWYYRVRGYDYDLPTSQADTPTNAPAMAWSPPTKIVITAPKLRVVSASRR
jgi:hypothetical protein